MSQGTFINGKQMAIELLQELSANEKDRILKNIRIKNPGLADELSAKSFSFANVESLDQNSLYKVCQLVSAPIFGIAIKGSGPDDQRNILRKLPRDYAEQVFENMNNRISNERTSIQRARGKVLEAVERLVKLNEINLY